MKTSNRIRSVGFALATAVIWGFAFAFQRISAGYMGTFTFNFLRGALATAALGVFTMLRKARGHAPYPPGKGKNFWRGGAVCGVFLCAASVLQQYGMSGSDASTAGFLTSLYIVLVPLLEVLLLRRKIPAQLWISVLLAMAGLYLISVTNGLHLHRSDGAIMLCGVMFAFQILAVDRFVKDADPAALCCVQFGVVTVLSAVGTALFERPVWRDALACLGALLYVGVVSGGVGYGMQMAAQRYGSPAAVTLITSTESLFSALGAALILHERLTGRRALGCAVMFAAVLLAQLPPEWFRRFGNRSD